MNSSRHPTRSTTDIWLIGQPIEALKTSVLISKREAMALFMNYKTNCKQTVKEALTSTAKDMLQVWEAAQIPTKLRKHVIEKLNSNYNEWLKLKKNKENKKKQTQNLLHKQMEWKQNLDDIFNIAHADALNLIDIEEDKKFLILQRQPTRKGKMAGVDKIFVQLQKAACEKEKK